MIKFKRLFFIFGLFFLVFPFFARAQIVISEIMYDLEGADSDREWIEIFNGGSSLIDLSGWKFFEDETNHSLDLIQGQNTLTGNGRAVIAADSVKFLIDWPNFSGMLFDSSFSLNNTGESLTIKDDGLNVIDTVVYSSSWGASGNGYSLQKVNNQWIAAGPTPGSESSGFSETGGQSFNATSSVSSESGSQTVFSGLTVSSGNSSSIKALAGPDKIVVAGAEIEFKGEAYGLKDEPLENAGYLWIFGDGTQKEGKIARHAYFFPGVYQAVLNVSSGYYSASDYLKITVNPNELHISEIKPATDGSSWIEIHNPSTSVLDISHWVLKSLDQKFVFPDSTYILSESFLAVPESVSAILPPPASGEVKFLYPTGFSADFFSYSGSLEVNESFNRVDGQTLMVIALESPGKKNNNFRQKQEIPPLLNLETESSSKTINLEVQSPKLPNSADMANIIETVRPPKVLSRQAIGGQAEDVKNNVWFWFLISLGTGIFSAAGFIFIKFYQN